MKFVLDLYSKVIFPSKKIYTLSTFRTLTVCIDIKKTTISNFGAALFYLMFAGLKDLFLDMESIGMKLFCDINVQMLSELSTFDCVPI